MVWKRWSTSISLFALLACGRPPPPGNAERAVATVMRLSGSKCSLFPDSGELCPSLVVTVYPTKGSPYSTSIETRIPEIASARVQPGSWIAVLVDPAAPMRVFVDISALSEAAPNAPTAQQ